MRRTVVIIGSGAAGLFCADGLVTRGDVDVILLEAGADAGTPPPDWLRRDLATPDDADWGLVDADTGRPLLRGRITGGCTSTNSAAALRGQPWCFDEWDIDGWRWDDVAPAFAALETDLQFGDRPGHGSTGPIPITRLSFGPVDTAFAQWAGERGHEWVEDQNAPGMLGVGHWPTNTRPGAVRYGVHEALLPRLRPHLRANTTAKRLLFDGTRCVGVETDTGTISADHVIVCAGSVESPALLLRSGIGPAADLAEAGIPLVHDAPEVGANLQDHPWTVLQIRATDPAAPALRPVNGVLLRYEILGDDRVEVHLYPHQAQPYLPDADAADVFLGLGLMRAISRGSVRLAPDGTTEVHLNHLGDPQDAKAFDLLLDDAQAALDALGDVLVPPDNPWWQDRNQLPDHLESYGHLVGTCRMGTDPGAVVDPTLTVAGVTGVSIADASIMPASPRANTMLTSMMIGLRGAALVADHLSE
ncbi:GMC family oxidoreductase N-terminal domain-containing protein [Winogradskya consettensis]|uniref:GMC family oxidoreductase n=2 Tax=Winogradskya TaxID=3240235 RepID=A0A919VRX0_9ACTN|nr:MULTISPECIES: GMC family oxidoreductase N-terminal domain-containing protein [Actinoplanes]GIE23173.1 GMC family oxidoreductase [Actinoplanes humidus]GIM76524.1 GMC family oxidoreductase [Actinoplanes consettensis]